MIYRGSDSPPHLPSVGKLGRREEREGMNRKNKREEREGKVDGKAREETGEMSKGTGRNRKEALET
jgi:hypothetical protein